MRYTSVLLQYISHLTRFPLWGRAPSFDELMPPTLFWETLPRLREASVSARTKTGSSGSVRTEDTKTHKIIQGFPNTTGGTMKRQPSVLAKPQVAPGRVAVAAPVEYDLFLCGEGGNTGVLRQMHGKSEQQMRRFQSHALDSTVV